MDKLQIEVDKYNVIVNRGTEVKNQIQELTNKLNEIEQERLIVVGRMQYIQEMRAKPADQDTEVSEKTTGEALPPKQTRKAK